MATTTNYSWTTPDDTDLVKDGAAAIRTLGSAIDTTVFNNAGAAISKSLIDAEGDLIVGDAADAVQRLAIGSNGNVLTVDTTVDGKIKWAAPAGGGKVLQVVYGSSTTSTTVASATYTDTTLSATITPSATGSKVMVIVVQLAHLVRSAVAQGAAIKLLRGATDILTPSINIEEQTFANFGNNSQVALSSVLTMTYLDSPNTTSATTYKTQGRVKETTNSGSVIFQLNSSTSTILLLEIGA